MICTLCDSTLKRKYSLQKHREKHRRQDQVLVQVCHKLWLPGLTLLLPDLGRDEETQVGDAQGHEGFVCNECEKPFIKFPGLVAHKSRVHHRQLLKSRGRKISVAVGRTKKAAQFKADSDAMDGEERKAYIVAVLKTSPEYLDNLDPNLFTTADIIEVRSMGLSVRL